MNVATVSPRPPRADPMSCPPPLTSWGSGSSPTQESFLLPRSRASASGEPVPASLPLLPHRPGQGLSGVPQASSPSGPLEHHSPGRPVGLPLGQASPPILRLGQGRKAELGRGLPREVGRAGCSDGCWALARPRARGTGFRFASLPGTTEPAGGIKPPYISGVKIHAQPRASRNSHQRAGSHVAEPRERGE